MSESGSPLCLCVCHADTIMSDHDHETEQCSSVFKNHFVDLVLVVLISYDYDYDRTVATVA